MSRVRSVADDAANVILTSAAGSQPGEVTLSEGGEGAWKYRFDAAQRLVSMTSPPVAGQAMETSFVYDAQGALTEAIGPGSATSFAYDAAGNRTFERDACGIRAA